MAGAYKVLGLLPDAGRDAAKKAFRRLASKFHPDKFTDPIEKKVAEAQFKRCKAALDFINTNGVNRGAKQSFSSAEEEYADAYAAWRKTDPEHNTPPPIPPNLDVQKQAVDKANAGEEGAYHNAYDEWYKNQMVARPEQHHRPFLRAICEMRRELKPGQQEHAHQQEQQEHAHQLEQQGENNS
jgi:curved DNA-binding protein CbpA